MDRPFSVPSDLYPFASRWLAVDGLPVHYIDEGPRDAPPILFLHGNPTWSFLYRDIVKGLLNPFRCIALDYPGMGMSGKPRDHGRPDYGFTPREHSRIVEGFVDALDLRDLTLMVQDWGGPIGLGMAGRRPERVARLIVGNTWAWPVRGVPYIERFSKLVGGPVGRFAILNFNAFVNFLVPGGVSNKRRLTKAVMAAYRAPFPTREDRMPTAVFPREILGSSDYLAEVEAGLERLRDKPALILWGMKDLAFRKAELERWRRLFPKAPVVALPTASHFIQEDAPKEIVDAIWKWMGAPSEDMRARAAEKRHKESTSSGPFMM